jgi:hypothetical protein
MTRDSVEVPVSRCIECGEPNDRAFPAEDHPAPCENDVSLCIFCGHISIYRADQTLREPTDDELITISQKPIVKKVLASRKTILGQADS